MPSTLQIALAACLALSIAADVSEDVSNSVFRSRGGDIVITHAEPAQNDAIMIAVDRMGAVASNDLPSDISETSFAGLIADIMGSSMTSEVPAQVEAFSSSVFNRPRANVLVAVPGLGSASLGSLPNLQALRDSLPSFAVSPSFQPRHTLSQLTTLLTGSAPSVHGIAATSWVAPSGKAENAFSVAGSHPITPSVADVVAKTFKSASVVGFSGSRAFAMAGAAHVRSAHERSYAISMDRSSVLNMAKTRGFPQTRLTDELIRNFVESADQHSLLSGLKSAGVQFAFDAESRVLTVSLPAETLELDLNVKSDRFFIAEIASLDLLVRELRTGDMHHLVVDASPDMFTLTLAGLEGLDNSKAASASVLVDSVVAQVLAEFDALYDSQLVAEVVLMGTPSAAHADARDAVLDSVRSSLHKKIDSEAVYPTMYLDHSLSTQDVEALCATAQSAASEYNLKAECVSELTRPVLLQQKSQSRNKADATTNQDVVDFQINLWISFVLVLLVLAALYPLFYIDVGSGIFSSFLFAKKYV